MNSHELMSKLNDCVEPLGYRVEAVFDVKKEPWAKFATKSWTYGLVAISSEKPGFTSDLLGPTFTCSNFSLPHGKSSKKALELRTWSKKSLEFARKNQI